MLKKWIARMMAAVLMTGVIAQPQALSAARQYAVENPEADLEAGLGNKGKNLQDGLSVQGVNGFGHLLADKISKQAAQYEENNGCNIFSVEMQQQTAEVSFETDEDATLVTGIYDETGTQMLASASVEVSVGDTKVQAVVEGAVPQYFYIRSFLVDSETLRPLCRAYESPMYTKEMQDFLDKTVSDFDVNLSERVRFFESNKAALNPSSSFPLISPSRHFLQACTLEDDGEDSYKFREAFTSAPTDPLISTPATFSCRMVIEGASPIPINTFISPFTFSFTFGDEDRFCTSLLSLDTAAPKAALIFPLNSAFPFTSISKYGVTPISTPEPVKIQHAQSGFSQPRHFYNQKLVFMCAWSCGKMGKSFLERIQRGTGRASQEKGIHRRSRGMGNRRRNREKGIRQKSQGMENHRRNQEKRNHQKSRQKIARGELLQR